LELQIAYTRACACDVALSRARARRRWKHGSTGEVGLLDVEFRWPGGFWLTLLLYEKFSGELHAPTGTRRKSAIGQSPAGRRDPKYCHLTSVYRKWRGREGV
jgi:hypothetical protein